ncbi:sugar ABC transporter substrate-binding protein [Microbacterium sp. E-13]|uniref:sugar ABC transporter substrate-binding protein n=1 Tax=Microbacterium sp. E-13 TaxID=3404048 RepID=UPI003CE69599
MTADWRGACREDRQPAAAHAPTLDLPSYLRFRRTDRSTQQSIGSLTKEDELRSITYRGVSAAVVALAAASALTACTTGLEESASGNDDRDLETVTFVNPLPDFPAWRVIGDCMKKEAEAQGLTYSESGPTGSSGDGQYMIDRIQQAIANDIDAIVTFPLTVDQFDPVFEEAKNAGIYVVTTEGGQTKNHDVNVGTSFVDFGELAAQTVGELDAPQVVGFLTSSSTGPDQTFIDSFTAYAEEHPELGITIADTRYDGADPTKSADLVAAMLTAHPDINHIVTNEGAATQPLVALLESKGLKGRVNITSNSIYGGSVEGMKAGYVYSFLLQDMCGIGTQSIDALVAFHEDPAHAPTDVATGIKFATAETVDELTADGTYQ